VILATNAEHTVHKEHSHSYWQGLKNAVHDMNPFATKLGHDWAETHNRVENIYEEMHRDAQHRVELLKEDTLKDQKELQQKIADIYQDAANEAERRIDKMKKPLIASLFRHYSGNGPEEESSSTSGGYVNKLKEKASDAAHAIKNKLTPHDESSMFEDASKKVSDAYRTAIDKAKEAVKDVKPGETWDSARDRAKRAYDELLHKTHHDTRTLFQRMRDGLGFGAHRAADAAEFAAVKTWHLVLHCTLGLFWMVLGAAVATGLKMYYERRMFNKQLMATVTGPILLSKEMLVVGNDETQRKFIDYWTNTASNFFKQQAGLRKFTLERGIDAGSNVYHHCSEWNSIDDLRRALAQPELKEIKKRMPVKGFISKRTIGQVITQSKGQTGEGDAGAGRAEGLRQRLGPGTTAQS